MSEVGEVSENIAWKADSPTPFIKTSLEKGLIKPGQTVVDIGCGFGRNSNYLESQGAKVIGININKEELDVARANAQKNKLSTSFIEANATKLPLDDSSYDVAIDSGCSHMLTKEGQIKAEEEQARIVKQGGYLLYFGFSKEHPAYKDNSGSMMYRDLEDVQQIYGNDFEILSSEKNEWKPAPAENATFDTHRGLNILMRRISKTEAQDKLATSTVKECMELTDNNEYLKALQTWFNVPQEKRTEILHANIRAIAGTHDNSSLAAIDRNLPAMDRFIFENFAPLSSEFLPKIVSPTKDTIIAADDLRNLSDQMEVGKDFRNTAADLGFHFGVDPFDFKSSGQAIEEKFTLEEMRQAIKNILSHTNEQEYMMIDQLKISHPVFHCELALDPEIEPYVRLLYQHENYGRYVGFLENCLVQNFFPSVAYFDYLYKTQPELTKPEAIYNDGGGFEIPVSVYYFSLLRKAVQLKAADIDPKVQQQARQKVAEYLGSKAFMDHVKLYLDSEILYKDEFVEPLGRRIHRNAEIEEKGEQVKTIKQQRLNEVITAVST